MNRRKPPRFPYRYRDWVIGAFNADVPYDRFIRLQLAADLIPNTRPDDFAALGFLGLSPVYHKEPKLSKDVIAAFVADEWDERVDVITRGFLGLTVASRQVPRPQVRPDHDRGLLRPRRSDGEYPTGGAAR